MESLAYLIVGGFISWAITVYFYKRQRRESVPMMRQIEAVHRKLQTGAMTNDDAAREIIKALERGALDPDSLESAYMEYKSCPDCDGDVEITNRWSGGYGEHDVSFGGHTIKCKRCAWKRRIEY